MKCLKLIITSALLFSPNVYAASEEIVGRSHDSSNFECADPDKNEQQREAALAHLQTRIRMETGICAWHSGYLAVRGEPQYSSFDLATDGCQVLATVEAECM